MATPNFDYKGLTAPKWNGKDDTALMYLEQLEVLAKVFGILDQSISI